ncbi:serine/threonine-protein kinase [Flectobacillus sp. BAB-3569]|uniref:serine/threonine-protein kinase n=1 Tax=Flectobacillus sp. BAB-3569 TaxID=1509483 RepID=UPI000BA4B007|nr:serine/threonine-protein kinase [Flectobacillus sp. BAB-3569]PAC28864.1 hypothetical protein BWI92_17685 [Flectobacillus sp. BAB-3569]
MDFKSRYIYNLKEDLIGKGGFARVYKAQDTLLDRSVAIKVFNKSNNGYYTVLEEIKKVIKYEHPNLIRYYDVALLDNTNAFGEREELQIGIMELANAGDLKTFVLENPQSPLILDLLKQVLLGLGFLHKKGIIHRDLKPQNILLVKEGDCLTAKISDFGISRNVEANTNSASLTIGTIEYMAPEQFNPARYGINGKISTNVDIWSFGIMLYELLVAEPPFGQRGGSTTAEQIMNSILTAQLPPKIDSIKEPFKSIIKKCLIADANLRIRYAEDLLPFFNGNSFSASRLDETDTLMLHKGNNKIAPVVNDETETQILSPLINSQDTITLPISIKSDATQILGEKTFQTNKQPKNIIKDKVAGAHTKEKLASQSISKASPKKPSILNLSKVQKLIGVIVGLSIASILFYYIFQPENIHEKAQLLAHEKRYDEAILLLKQHQNDKAQSANNRILEQLYLAKGDTMNAFLLMQKSFAKSDFQNAYLLGQLYYSGKFTKQDFSMAKKVFEKIEKDDRAQTMLGNLYFMGLGVKKTIPKPSHIIREHLNKVIL